MSQDLPLITKENCDKYRRDTIPTSWRCEPIQDLPDPDTPILVFHPDSLEIPEPCYLGKSVVEKK